MIIVIAGPTAVGKTKLSIELSKKFNAEIINSDSTQVYKKMDIATAKATKEEMEGIPHHLIDIKEYDEDYSIYDYQLDGRKKIDEILKKGKNVVIVGGSGLYIKALLYDYRFVNGKKDSEDYSIEELILRIKKIDPNIKIDEKNKRRLERTLINLENGLPVRNENKLLYENTIFIGLKADRKVLYDKINERTDEMFDMGLIEEAKYFYDKKKMTKALKTVIGYKELFKYFDKEISLEEAKEEIKKNCRHYAKRQYTWFNNKMDLKWFDVNYEDFSKTINEVIRYVENKYDIIK